MTSQEEVWSDTIQELPSATHLAPKEGTGLPHPEDFKSTVEIHKSPLKIFWLVWLFLKSRNLGTTFLQSKDQLTRDFRVTDLKPSFKLAPEYYCHIKLIRTHCIVPMSKCICTERASLSNRWRHALNEQLVKLMCYYSKSLIDLINGESTKSFRGKSRSRTFLLWSKQNWSHGFNIKKF